MSILLLRGSGGALSVLGTAAAAMPSGTFAAYTVNGLPSSVTANNDSGILAYAPIGSWDPLHKLARFIGTSHSNVSAPANNVTRHIVYDDAADLWSQATSPAADGRFDHGYYDTCVNPNDGYTYHRVGNGVTTRVLPYGGVWTDNPDQDVTGSGQVSGIFQYYQKLFSNAGGLIWADGDNGVCKFNPQTLAWSAVDTTPGRFGSYANGAAIADDGNLYVGGGGGLSTLYRVNASGSSITQVADTPFAMGSGLPDGASSIHSSPLVGGRMWMISNADGAIWDYDSGGNQWFDTELVIPNWPIGGTGRYYSVIPVSTYGVNKIIYASGSNTSGLLYKPSR